MHFIKLHLSNEAFHGHTFRDGPFTEGAEGE